jgi:hypothetical protein
MTLLQKSESSEEECDLNPVNPSFIGIDSSEVKDAALKLYWKTTRTFQLMFPLTPY